MCLATPRLGLVRAFDPKVIGGRNSLAGSSCRSGSARPASTQRGRGQSANLEAELHLGQWSPGLPPGGLAAHPARFRAPNLLSDESSSAVASRMCDAIADTAKHCTYAVVEVELLVRGHHQTTERTVAIDCGCQECSSALLTLVAVAASGGECAPVAAVSLAA